MRDRAIFLTRPLCALVCFFALSLSASPFLFAEEQLELPQRVSELNSLTAEKTQPTSSEVQDFTALKSTLKFEIIKELRSDENLNWTEKAKPRLNFVELNGYFRTRGHGLGRCALGTYVPSLGFGTSQCPPPLAYFPKPALVPDTTTISDAVTTSNWHISSDIRFRFDPTLNISEDIRIRGRFDILDNLVLGSTPSYMTGAAQPNPSFPISVLSHNQNSPLLGMNSSFGPLAVKRLWGEIAFPYGEFRFGRMPLGFGLGILYNDGDKIDQDFGNNVDGVFFETDVYGYRLTPGFTVSYAGPTGRGGGLGAGGDSNIRNFALENGAQYDLDPSDNVYNVHLKFAKNDSEGNNRLIHDELGSVWNYGAMGTYRFQLKDSLYFKLSDDKIAPLSQTLVERNAHLGLLSLWSYFRSGGLVIEGEAAGIFGVIASTEGLWPNQPMRKDQIAVYQGGVAIESRYGFMQDRLQIGVDAGWASGDPEPGFGIRPGTNNVPANGAADGQQFVSDNVVSNFTFDRDYRVDLLLFREVLGSVTDALYLKPHLAYYFTENFGLRGDVIGSMSNFARSTPGNNNFLGIELDGSLFFKTKDGFVFNAQYGHLFPFSGLNHDQGTPAPPEFRQALSASALRIVAGITF